MGIVSAIQPAVSQALVKLYNAEIKPTDILITETKPEFEGDYTVVLFSFVKSLKKSPEQLGKELGEELMRSHSELFVSFNVIKGFLNLIVSDNYWKQFLHTNFSNKDYGKQSPQNKKVMVEYSSPNTNKPLHLGHLRNNFLGWSIAAIFKQNGYDVAKTCIANDRGIHICKSMIAWQLFGNGATPQSTGMKGDHFVGDYYVQFGNELKKEVEKLIQIGMSKEEAEKEAREAKG